ncbi:alcohol dehydrogenase catalytic domain-containing protein [Pseudomonas aeruginosa]|uniref:alcohol dehydrogenase catalytic domain-containing protein n=1 Tax=Pseudomonas aeruginosa TaxID=287 RepID=UPI001EE049F3|nr:alcohol dehydrogenase catalytic domain-containing protein [Pseudomonas aeruginosa]
MKVNTFKFPELITPQGKSAPHGAILKIVTTNICGSDLHIYRGSFAVPKGMTMGHEMTGEVIEVGSDVEVVKKGDIVSVPFNVGCGRCYNVSVHSKTSCHPADFRPRVTSHSTTRGYFHEKTPHRRTVASPNRSAA